MFGESSLKIGGTAGPGSTSENAICDRQSERDRESESDDPEQVAGEVIFKADKVTVGQQSGTGSVQLALGNLDGPTAAQIEQWQQKPQARRSAGTRRLAGTDEGVAARQAGIRARHSGHPGPRRVAGKLTLNFQDPGAINPAQDPMSLLGALEWVGRHHGVQAAGGPC